MLRRIQSLVVAAVAIVLFFFAMPFWFGIAYVSSGAVLGMLILFLLLLVQFPMMRVIKTMLDVGSEEPQEGRTVHVDPANKGARNE
jgi:hypothetical protein